MSREFFNPTNRSSEIFFEIFAPYLRDASFRNFSEIDPRIAVKQIAEHSKDSYEYVSVTISVSQEIQEEIILKLKDQRAIKTVNGEMTDNARRAAEMIEDRLSFHKK